jgi:hypothetical protein
VPAVTRPLYIEQGATFRFGFNWHRANDADPTQPGEAYDLTGWHARMQIRKNQQSPILVDASDTNGKITLGGNTGRIDIVLSDDDTDLLTTKSAQYDLEVEDPDGVVYRLLEGQVTVSPNITQETDDPPVGA